MKIYFLQFKVTPTDANAHFDIVKGALASSWVEESSFQSAITKAKFYVHKSNWVVDKIEFSPVEVTKEHYVESPLGLELFLRAQKEGIVTFFSAWARDGKATIGPFTIKSSSNFELSRYMTKQLQLAAKGRCLHYENGPECNEPIKAHSIQKSGALASIADEGHVYKLSASIRSLKKNKDRPIYEKYGIKNVSTFLGFCQKHDNDLFAPIDNAPLTPTAYQVLLYAYRSLCRELFVQENALELFECQLGNDTNNKVIENLFVDHQRAVFFGLKNLRRHKKVYDNTFKKSALSKIKYVLFKSKQKPIMAFSGLLYPDFDFMGERLQDLSDYKSKLELITFCSAPMASGWGLLFAWHETSSKVCVDYMRSLATMVHNNNDALGDFLFRLVVSSCENLAISPKWWESLPLAKKDLITLKASLMVDIFSTIDSRYLMEGLEGISQWNFENVICNME